MISEHQGDSWKPTTLEHCGRWISGGTPSRDRSDFWNGTVPWISAKSMNCIRLSDSEECVTHLGAENGAKFAPKGSILILVRGSMLHQRIPIGITTRDVTFNQDVKAIVPYSDVLPEFLLYWLLSNESKLLEMVEFTGIGAGKLSTDLLYNMEVKLPPLPEQRAIARILGTLDDKIELNRRMNETLEAIARTIFKSWFVDFDPVRAKAEGRESAGMDAETAALFPDSFEETEMGMVPKGWKLKSLDEIANFLNGLAMQKFPPESEDFLPVIKIAELHRGNTIGSDRASSNIDPRYIIEDGDLLFSWSGSLEVCIWCGGKGALNQHLFKVSSTEYPMWFLYFWLKEHLPEFQLIAAGKATTMGHIQRYHLSEAKAATSIAPLIERVNVIIEPLLNLIIKNNLESRSLSLIRDALLPRLLLGEIRVRGTEKSLEDLPSKEKLATC
ncbi:MAG: restriction endonuclease subunit S [Methanothrix sp.]